MAAEHEADFVRLAQSFERAIVRGQSLEAAVLVALLALEEEVDKGVIPLRRVGALVNSDRPERERVTAQMLARVIRALGLGIKQRGSGSVILYRRSYLDLLAARHGIEEVRAEPGQAAV